MKTNYTYTTEEEVGEAFWDANPQWPVGRERWERGWKQNQFDATIRSAFCEFVDHLQKSGEISDKLADRVTL